ncbi:hypothetical protein HYDPIDRAFT_109459 [Hydnomerulius pinastri MD-312]|nr:hypothetical protein HYDPIDRAFT_109459 [Hydnomerulius pinastri MD-312]
MDEDVDMDAPQISTLREENTPPPSRTSKFRVKLLVGDKKGKGKSSSPSVSGAPRKNVPPPPQPQSRAQSDEDEEEEDEEDQLIDDEDEPAPSISAPVGSASAGTKRKAPAKKPRPRKSEKQDKDADKKAPEPQEPGDNWDGQSASTVAAPDKPPPKKKAAPRKAPAASKPKAKAAPKGAKALAVPPVDDSAMSETHTITAPSSPLPHSRVVSPEPEEVEPPSAPAPEGSADTAPLPVYPLPSKPFPVQPPPKIGTGFAPMQPLDRNGTKVRRWRTANREIRGIAGGRWFARSWVGDKESDLATAAAAAAAAAAAKLADGEKIAIPKSLTSISAPILGKAGKSKAARASAGISAAPSRSGSIVPDLHPPKAPTKMRNIVAGPASEAGDDPETVIPEPPTVAMES